MNIKELALKVAAPFKGLGEGDAIEFATRLFAARDAEAVPVGYVVGNYGDGFVASSDVDMIGIELERMGLREAA